MGEVPMKDQAVLFYCKDDVLYPVALTEEQRMMFEMTVSLLSPLTIIGDKPLGAAINLLAKKGAVEQ